MWYKVRHCAGLIRWPPNMIQGMTHTHTHIGSTHNCTHHPKAQALVDVHAGAFLMHAYCCTFWNTHSLFDMILCTPMRALAPAMSLLTYASTHACPHKNFSASCLSDFHYVKHCEALKAGVGARSVPLKTDIQFEASSMWGGFCIDPCCFYVQGHHKQILWGPVSKS